MKMASCYCSFTTSCQYLQLCQYLDIAQFTILHIIGISAPFMLWDFMQQGFDTITTRHVLQIIIQLLANGSIVVGQSEHTTACVNIQGSWLAR